MKRLLAVAFSFILSLPAVGKELLYTGKDFTLKVPAYNVATIELPCEVTATAYPKERLQLKLVKSEDRTVVYLLPTEEESTVALTCVDKTYTFKLRPVDLRPKKKLECKNGKCQIVEVKPEVDLSQLPTHYTVIDPSVVKEKSVNPTYQFSSKQEIIDEGARLLSAMVQDKKPTGYLVRKKKLIYRLTPDIKVELLKFYKGVLYGQVLELTNESYFPVEFSVPSLDGNGNVFLYSPSMDRDGVIHFSPKGKALLYVVSVKQRLKLPYKQVVAESNKEQIKWIRVEGLK